jgi:hypothetical protein
MAPMSCGQTALARSMSWSSAVSLSVGLRIVLTVTWDRSA